MKTRKFLFSFMTCVCLLGMSAAMPSAHAETVFQDKTPEQLAAEFVQEEYVPNQSITGEYDKTLAVKCENGIFVGYSDGDVLVYKGIPYATQPLGKLRWKRPLPPAKSDKVFQAWHSGKAPIQPGNNVVTQGQSYKSGEDCLTLNIFANKADTTKKKPVMVWIHGGAWTSGSTAEPHYNGKTFVTNNPDVILVTTTYRLGVMGFVNFANIKGGKDYKDVNLGSLDQIAALKWVKNNIAAFGGDPECVTVFGESAGGGSISVLAVHPEAKGLFRRAIIQSGSVALCMDEKASTGTADNLAKHFNAKSMADLNALTEDQIKEYWNKYCSTTSNFIVAEEKQITKDPFNLWKKGVTKKIDIMQGVMANEWRLFSSLLGTPEFFAAYNTLAIDNLAKECKDKEYHKVCAKYRELMKQRFGKWADTEFISEHFFVSGMRYQALQHAKNGGKSYVYVMDQPMDIPELNAAHGTDVFYTFGNFDGQMVKGTALNQKLAITMQRMWVNFAKTGDPSTPEYKWPQYDEKKRATMILGPEIHVENDPARERRELTDKMWKLNPSYRYPKTLAQVTVATMQAHPELLQAK